MKCRANLFTQAVNECRAREEFDPESVRFKPNLNCNYSLPINVAPSGILFGAKSIGYV